jgi:hypothetical protein
MDEIQDCSGVFPDAKKSTHALSHTIGIYHYDSCNQSDTQDMGRRKTDRRIRKNYWYTHASSPPLVYYF